VAIVPTAQTLILCDYFTQVGDEKPDLYGLFNAIRPAGSYPHQHERFCTYARLRDGQGKMSCYIGVRLESSETPICMTSSQDVDFQSREMLVQVVMGVSGCVFEQPGYYLVELYCNDCCVADTALLLLPSEVKS
jgi:hypothetical protein